MNSTKRSWRSCSSKEKAIKEQIAQQQSAIESLKQQLADLSQKIAALQKEKYDIWGSPKRTLSRRRLNCRPSSRHWTRFRACPSKTCSNVKAKWPSSRRGSRRLKESPFPTSGECGQNKTRGRLLEQVKAKCAQPLAQPRAPRQLRRIL